MADITQKLERILGSLADYRINSDLILIPAGQNKLGQGGYGDVWLGEMTLEDGADSEDGHSGTRGVAVKTLRQATGTKEELTLTACQLARELKVWAGLLHPNVLKLVGFHLSDTLEKAWLVSPYEPEGNLAEFMYKRKPDKERKMELVFDALCGLRYLHSHTPNIVHGDLKPANIIIGRDGFAKLCDFGLAKALGESTGLTRVGPTQGTLRYMSPELFDEDAAATLSSDVWAFACVAGEVFTGQAPYHSEKASHRIIMQITFHKVPIPLDQYALPPELEAWLRKCWNPEANERPSAVDSIDSLKRCMERTFPASSRLFQAVDPPLPTTPSQPDDFFVELNRARLRKQSKDHPDYAETLKNLAFALAERFEADRRPEDLDEAVTLQRQALQLFPSGHSARGDALENLIWPLEDRFTRFGDAKDLEETIELRQEVLRMRPVGDLRRFWVVERLVWSLISRADTYGDPTGINSSVELARELLDQCPEDCQDRSSALNALGWSLHQRFKFQGDDNDLEKAIILLREGSTPGPVKDRTIPYVMCGLACALRTKFEKHGDKRDILEAVSVIRQSVQLTDPTVPSWPNSEGIMFLGTILAFSFRIGGEMQVIDEAIELHRQSLQLCPGRHAYRYTHLLSLGRSLRLRGGVTDLTEARQLLEEALLLVPEDSPGNMRRQAKVKMRLEELEAFGSTVMEAQRLVAVDHTMQSLE